MPGLIVLGKFNIGACLRLDWSTAGVLDVARSSDPFRGMLKKAASRVLGLAGQPF